MNKIIRKYLIQCWLFFIVLIVITTSCYKSSYHTNYYNVINNTNYNVKIIFNGLLYNSTINNINKDSIITIVPEQKKTILVEVYNPRNTTVDNSNSIYGLKGLKIYMNDTLLSQNDYTLKEYWESSSSNNKLNTNFKLTLTNSDFPGI